MPGLVVDHSGDYDLSIPFPPKQDELSEAPVLVPNVLLLSICSAVRSSCLID